MGQKQAVTGIAIVLVIFASVLAAVMPVGTVSGVPDAAPGNIGVNFPISQGQASETAAGLAYSPDSDRYLAVWQDSRNGTSRIYGQILTGNGSLVGGNFPISGLPPYLPTPTPVVTATATPTPSPTATATPIPPPTATPTGTITATSIVATLAITNPNQWMPSVAYNSSSKEFVVAWGDERDWDIQGTDVYGRRVSNTGALLGADFLISGGQSDQYDPRVTCKSAANECLVAWTDGRNKGDSGLDVYGQRIGGDGSLLGPNILIVAGPGDEKRPSIAFDSSVGRYLVAYFLQAVPHNDDSHDIRGQLVGGDGSLVGGTFPIATAPGNQMRPAAVFNTQDKEFMLVWYDLRSGIDADIYGQRISEDGAPLGENVPIATGPGDQFSPALAYNPVDDNYRVLWYAIEAGTQSNSPIATLLSLVLSASAVPIGEKTVVSAWAKYPTLPVIAYNSLAQEYLAAWQDGRDYDLTQYDIYGQRITLAAPPSPTPTPTATLVPTATSTSTPVPTATSVSSTPIPTATSTSTPVPTATSTSIPLPTATSTSTPLPTATSTSTPAPTATPVSGASGTPVPASTSIPTALPTATMTPTPAVIPSEFPFKITLPFLSKQAGP